MLPTFKQIQHLIPNGEESYLYDGKATAEERQELKELDEANVFLQGKHLIDNYKDL